MPGRKVVALRRRRASHCRAGRDLEGFIPKGPKDFEELGRLVAGKYLLPHAKSAHYKGARFPSVLVRLGACCARCCVAALGGWLLELGAQGAAASRPARLVAAGER